MKIAHKMILVVCLLSLSPLAHAYIGPGAGLSAIGSIIVFIGAILLMIVGFLWYPIKRLVKGKQEDATHGKSLAELDADKPDQ